MEKTNAHDVVVVIGAGSIGQACARRVSSGRHVLLADLRLENAEAAARTLSEAGFEVSTATVDISSRESVEQLADTATAIGPVVGLINAAGVSPSQATPETILRVDLYGTALVLGVFGDVIAPGGSGRNPGRGRQRGRTAHGPGRCIYHRQRLPHGRRRHRVLLLWPAGPGKKWTPHAIKTRGA